MRSWPKHFQQAAACGASCDCRVPKQREIFSRPQNGQDRRVSRRDFLFALSLPSPHRGSDPERPSRIVDGSSTGALSRSVRDIQRRVFLPIRKPILDVRPRYSDWIAPESDNRRSLSLLKLAILATNILICAIVLEFAFRAYSEHGRISVASGSLQWSVAPISNTTHCSVGNTSITIQTISRRSHSARSNTASAGIQAPTAISGRRRAGRRRPLPMGALPTTRLGPLNWSAFLVSRAQRSRRILWNRYQCPSRRAAITYR